MDKVDKEILTTAETAKLLGVSVRTAQLLIEGGSICSWKTPGGHRRVYRADVMALVEDSRDTPLPSATVAIVAPADRLAMYNRLFADMPEYATEMHDNVHAALFAIGSVRPHAILVDLERAGDVEQVALLHSLAVNPSLSQTPLLAVVAPGTVALPERVQRVETAEQAAAALRASLAGPGEAAMSADGLPFPIALNEGQRLVAMEQTGLLDTAPEEAFDRLTWLAATSLNAPIALMTLLTTTRQWFKSRYGLDIPESPRSWAFCNHTILQKQVFSVEDLASDARFLDNPAVAGELGFRFYAGAPVTDGHGFVVGSLCVIDHRPRTLDQRETQTLLALAALASGEVRLRAVERQLRDRRRKVGHDASIR
jgi:excisionase family DNA binding protein